MCNDIYNKFQECGCRVYQNTFQCHVVRRCGPEEDLLLPAGPPVHLPARTSKVPPGLLQGCERKVATRPQQGMCPACRKTAKAVPSRKEPSSSSSSSTSRTTATAIATPTTTPTKGGTRPAPSASTGSDSGGSSSTMSGKYPAEAAAGGARLGGIAKAEAAPNGTPSPDSRALARVRDSFARVVEEHPAEAS